MRITLWSTPALLTALWLAASLPFPKTLNVIATGVMSISMILAIRASWPEGWLNGV